MSIASKEAVSSLQSEFNISATSKIGCHTNGLIAGLKIFIHEGVFPRIIQVELTKKPLDPPEKQDFHAYLVHKGTVYNTGVTWSDDTYPDIDYKTIQERGRDVTSILLAKTIEPLVSEKDDLNLLPILDAITEGNPRLLKPILVNAWLQVNNATEAEILNGSFSKTS